MVEVRAWSRVSIASATGHKISSVQLHPVNEVGNETRQRRGHARPIIDRCSTDAGVTLVSAPATSVVRTSLGRAPYQGLPPLCFGGPRPRAERGKSTLARGPREPLKSFGLTHRSIKRRPRSEKGLPANLARSHVKAPLTGFGDALPALAGPTR